MWKFLIVWNSKFLFSHFVFVVDGDLRMSNNLSEVNKLTALSGKAVSKRYKVRRLIYLGSNLNKLNDTENVHTCHNITCHSEVNYDHEIESIDVIRIL